VAIAADGRFYVADGYNDRIQVFRADGEFSYKWGGPLAMNIFGPFNGWFATATSVALDQNGNVFVADFYNHRVQKFARDGTFLTGFGARGNGPGQFEHPIAVAIASDGSVFVTDFGNHRVQKWRAVK
jgi:DNA-binding beta-propeller fold protein YncE